jgi:peptidyl-dipeptidase Dcp
MNSCNTTSNNPFFAETWDTPFGVAPFDQIQFKHFKPALLEGMKRHNAEIEAIVSNPEAPTFENTIVALDHAGLFLERVWLTFVNLNMSERTEQMANLDEQMAPIMSEHFDGISMNPQLFESVKAGYEIRENLGVGGEDVMLLEVTYKGFVRGSANLDDDAKAKLKEINEQISVLATQFGRNVQNENNAFRLIIDNEADLSGLPAGLIASAAELATREGHAGKWSFTLDRPVWTPFLTHADNRDLREVVFKAMKNRGNNDDENDNKEIAARIASLKLQRARLMGFETAGHFILDDRMAQNPETVRRFLEDLWGPILRVLNEEAKILQGMIDADGGGFTLQPWDWWYYAERVKKQKYDFDESEFRQYLKLENVIQGCFYVTSRLWGLQFEERFDIPKFNPENRIFLVKDACGTELGIFIADYHPRPSKRQGAWMWFFRQQWGYPNNNVLPIVTNVSNYTAPVGDQPALISIAEATTLFHEMGHALHMLLSKSRYRTLSGTNVLRDFVELPSSIMENWAMHPEVLRIYAKHWQTGEVIPDELIERMQRAGRFNQGFHAGERTAASWLDYHWHMLTDETLQNTLEFEKSVIEQIGLIDQIIPRFRSTYFLHIFVDNYDMGYYSYYWAEVLDADAFQAFVESGDIFNPVIARRFRETVLERGGTVHPMDLFMQFRGREPNSDPFLRRLGLK